MADSVEETAIVATHPKSQDPHEYAGCIKKIANNNATRLAAAAALSDGAFRKHAVAIANDKVHAKAPELGLDVHLALNIAQALETRELRYSVANTIIAGIFLSFLAADLATAAAGAGIAFGILRVYKLRLERYEWPALLKREQFSEPDCAAQWPDTDQPKLPDPSHLTVYHDFNPFVGAGSAIGAWGVAVDISRPRRDALASDPPRPVTIDDLYQHLETAIKATGLPELHISDHFFLHGSDVRDFGLLPDEYSAPLRTLPAAIAKSCVGVALGQLRHYKWVTVSDRERDFVVSVFLRCSVTGDNLLVEVKYFILPPVKKAYREIDRLSLNEWHTFTEFAVRVIGGAPFAAVAAPLKVLAAINEAFDDGRSERKAINQTDRYNYGAVKSLRESLASRTYEHYFEKEDAEAWLKTLARQILNALVDFLETHGIDTSEVKEQQIAILNSGIIVQGGDVTAQSLAVGEGAQARISKVARTVAAKASGGKNAA